MRLTKKELCSYTNMDLHSIQMDWHSIYNKLAEFEDFMEEQGFESLEELKNTVSNIEKLMLISAKTTNLEQENQAHKARWEKLKEHITQGIENDYNGCAYIYPDGLKKMQEILEKMQELEEEC